MVALLPPRPPLLVVEAVAAAALDDSDAAAAVGVGVALARVGVPLHAGVIGDAALGWRD